MVTFQTPGSPLERRLSNLLNFLATKVEPDELRNLLAEFYAVAVGNDRRHFSGVYGNFIVEGLAKYPEIVKEKKEIAGQDEYSFDPEVSILLRENIRGLGERD